MRKDVEFKTEDGVTLRGWLYLPDEARGRVPTIVMAHGFSAVKENYLDKYAEVFCRQPVSARLSSTIATSAPATVNPASTSTHGGRSPTIVTPLLTPSTLSEVDVNRIGIWGSSYSGAHVLGRRCNRPPRQMRRLAGAADQRPSQRTSPDPRGYDRDCAGYVCRGPKGALCRQSLPV